MVARIVVGIDGSGPSSAALRWALSRDGAAELLLVHVIDDDWNQVGAAHPEELRQEAERMLTAAQAQARSSGRTVRLSVQHGNAAKVLAEQTRPGELLVLGSHKSGYLRGRVLGTRGITVASLARSSVVVVPEENLAHRQGVIVGVTAGPESHAAILAGASEAQRLQQELFLIHAGPDLPDAVEAGRRLLAEAVELSATVAPGIVVRRRLSHRRASDTLLDASRASCLLVLGAASSGDNRAALIGSVSHEVLLNLTSTAMVAR